MTDFISRIIQQLHSGGETFLGLNSTTWTGIYTLVSIVTLYFVWRGLRLTTDNLKQIEEINQKNNEIQKDRILQERLIELSHEWNSKDFIEARNRAAVLMEKFKGKETSMYPTLVSSKKLDDWIMVSMIAHFFERLSYIQLSRQIYRKNAILEFKEAIEYWHFPLTLAYSYDEKTEERIRKAWAELKHEYQKPESDIP